MSYQDHEVQTEGGMEFSLLAPVVTVITLIAIAAAGVFFLRGKVDVVVTSRAIPPFTRMTAEDFSPESRYSQGHELGGSSVGDFIGKYSSEELAEGQEVDPAAVFDATEGIGAVRFQLRPDRVEALDLVPGDRVRLWLSPTDEKGRPLALCARLLQIPESESAEEQTYVVGLSRRNAKRLVTRLGRSRLLMARLS